MSAKGGEALSEAEVEGLIAEILRRTREHPDLSRGASVRGGIALREVLRGLEAIRDVADRRTLERAAIIALPHRVKVKFSCRRTPEDVIAEITRQVLYRRIASRGKIRVLKELFRKMLQDGEEGLNPEEPPLPPGPELSEHLSSEKGYEENREAFRRLLGDLEDDGLLKAGLDGEGRFRYLFTEDAVRALIGEVEGEYERGAISAEAHRREKEALERLLDLAEERPEPSDESLVDVVAEVMDLQDEFGAPISFDNLYAHYLIKADRGEEVESALTDYRRLQVIVRNLSRRGVLSGGFRRGKPLAIAEGAFIRLLDELIPKVHRERAGRGRVRARAHSEIADIRRYRRGDVFRDISVRKTFRQMVKRRKNLREARKDDLRSFVRRPKTRLDIALAIDVSHSMGYESKIRFARIAAAMLAKEAVDEGDRVAVVAFSSAAHVVVPLTDRLDEVMSSVLSLKAAKYTNIGDAIRCSAGHLLQAKDGNRKHIILLTDGEPTASSKNHVRGLSIPERRIIGEEYAIREAERAASKGVRISILLITGEEEANIEFAEKITRTSGGHLHRIVAAEKIPEKIIEAWEKAKTR